MKSKLLILALLMGVCFTTVYAQPRAKIRLQKVTVKMLPNVGTNSVATGMYVIPKGTFTYMTAENIGTDPVLTKTFTLELKPSGSTAAIVQMADTIQGGGWFNFRTDLKGEYKVKLTITTAGGTDDTIMSIFAGDFVGVGGFEGTTAAYPQCMSCHGSMPAFQAVFAKWQTSLHSRGLKELLSFDAGATHHFRADCIKCHTTGPDVYVANNNNGFDDLATQLGWVFTPGANPGKWDSLKTNFPALINHATIGCENCHGAGSEHAQAGDKKKIQISYDEGVCMQCHDRHSGGTQYNASMHSVAIWSSSFAQTASSQNNSLGNCIRCHDSKGFVNFTKGLTTNTTGMLQTDHEVISCQTCHDPHAGGRRVSPVAADTLGNAYNYSAGATNFGGEGKLCMSCHKSRRDNVTYVQTGVTSSHWGPHHNAQTDIFLGQNAAEYGTPYLSSNHKYAVADACVQCHMVEGPGSGNVNRNTVGGHTFRLRNPLNNFEYTGGCQSCHGPKTSFQDFVAAMDYDGNGQIEGIQHEVEGLLHWLRYWLPPAGVDSISYTLINNTPDNLNIKKAYWNYQLIEGDGSLGMHNTKYTISVLLKSIAMIGGDVPVELVSFSGLENNGLVTLKWETGSEVNNSGFSVERKVNGVWSAIAFVDGNGTTTKPTEYTFTDDLRSAKITGKVVYRLKQVDFDGTSSYTKEVELTYGSSPVNFTLDQNFPNPFNPSTTIKFSIPQNSTVTLAIYDAMGNLVKTLTNEALAAGKHEVNWNGDNNSGTKVSSGIYFYKLTAGSFTLTRKMVMMK